jgi:hypothetical protein
MSDDIAKRLRDEADGHTNGPVMLSPRTCLDTAAEIERLRAALRPLLSDKARKLLTDHANAAHVMGDQDYRAIADAIRMLLDKDARARAALSPSPSQEGKATPSRPSPPGENLSG